MMSFTKALVMVDDGSVFPYRPWRPDWFSYLHATLPSGLTPSRSFADAPLSIVHKFRHHHFGFAERSLFRMLAEQRVGLLLVNGKGRKEYEADHRKRLQAAGEDPDRPHRIKYKRLA